MKEKKSPVLAVSSASRDIEVALTKGGKVLAEHFVSDAGSENIMEYVDIVLKGANRTIKDVSLVVVTIGPGSYGGLRGGLACAKGVAQGRGIPMVAVPTLEAVAYNMADIEGLVAVVLPALKDDHNAALFGCARGKVARITDDFAANEAVIARGLSRIEEVFYLASPGEKILERIKEMNPRSKVRTVDAGNAHPRARSVAMLGSMMLESGRLCDALTCVPDYSHDPNIREFGKK